MFKRLIDTLTLHYTYMAKSRGIMDDIEREALITAGRTLVRFAPQTMVPDGAQMDREDKADLKECEMIVDHTQQLAEWIEQLRITEII